MKVTKVPGIELRHLGVTQLPTLEGFRHPEVQIKKEQFYSLARKYELSENFDKLNECIASTVGEGKNLENDPGETYAIALNRAGEVVGFAYTGGTNMSTVIEGRRRDIPDIHYAYVHPEYRSRGIGTAMCEKLLQHHTFLRVDGVSYLGEKLASKMLMRYGHPEEDNVIRAPKRTRTF